MGLSNKKTKQTSSGTETATTERTNPAWVTDALSGFTGKVTGLLDDNPSDYVSPANPLQTQAGAAASGLGGWRDMIPSSPVQASSLLTGLDDYMSPYTQDVVDTTLADFDVDAGRTRAAQAAAGARGAAFGGSRFGVAEAATEGELARARATADAQLRDSAFNTGAGLSNLDAGRRQEADLANQASRLAAAQLRSSGDRADLEAQMGIGGALRDIDTEGRQAELGLLGAVGGLLGQGQFGLFGGSNSSGTSTGTGTTSSSGGLLGSLGALVGLGSSGLDLASKWRGF